MKALVGAFNQEKAQVGAFSVIVKTDCETDGALHSTNPGTQAGGSAAICTSGLYCSSFPSQDIHLVLADCSSSPLAPSLASDSRKYIQNGLKV